MTNLEIDEALALATDYLPEHIRVNQISVEVCRPFKGNSGEIYDCWSEFDHRDPDLIWPLAAKYKLTVNFKTGGVNSPGKVPRYAGTPEAGVALEIIRITK